MRHATAIIEAVFLATALRRIQRFIHGGNDVGHRDPVQVAGDGVAATRATHAFDQCMPAQPTEQLFQIRQ